MQDDAGEEAVPVSGRTLVVMPTYDERGNIRSTLSGVLARCPQVDILVVDDGSPDGTGVLADGMARSDRRIRVIHRAGKQGLGPAYLEGFRWALDQGYDIICEMDMDGSHRPADLVRILAVLASDPCLDLVIGSRRVKGGRTANWPWYRDLISRGGSLYARIMLGLPAKDVTAGFRAYRARILRRIPLDQVRSNGYVFQIDMLRRVLASGGHVAEVPIVFVERKVGSSKMSSSIVAEAMVQVTRWGVERLRGGLRSVPRKAGCRHSGR